MFTGTLTVRRFTFTTSSASSKHTHKMNAEYRRSLELDAQAAGIGVGAHLMASHILSDVLYRPNPAHRLSDSSTELLDYFVNGGAERDLELPNNAMVRLEVVRRLFPVPRELTCLVQVDEFHSHVLTPASRAALRGSAKGMRLYHTAAQRFLDHFSVPSLAWNPDKACQVIREIARTQTSEVVLEVCQMMFRVMASTYMLSSAQYEQLAAAFSRRTFREICRSNSNKMCQLNSALSWSDFTSTLKRLRERYATQSRTVPTATERGIAYPASPVSEAELARERYDQPDELMPLSTPPPPVVMSEPLVESYESEEIYSEPPQPEEPYSEPPQPEELHSEPPQPEEPYSEPPQPEELYSAPPQPEEPYSEPPQPEEPYPVPPQPEERLAPANPYAEQEPIFLSPERLL